MAHFTTWCIVHRVVGTMSQDEELIFAGLSEQGVPADVIARVITARRLPA